MNWADWAIIAILLISGFFGLRRGFIKETLSLVTWVAAFIVARLFGQALATVLVDYISTPSVRLVSAFVILFVITLIVGALLSNFIQALVEATGLSGTDRMLGMAFGIIRGGLIVVVLVVLLAGTPAVQDAWWSQSELIPHFALMESWTRQVASDVASLIWNAGR